MAHPKGNGTAFRCRGAGYIEAPYQYFAEGELQPEATVSKMEIVQTKGSRRTKQAEAKAKAEYDEFNKTQKIISDFEKELKSSSKRKRNNNDE